MTRAALALLLTVALDALLTLVVGRLVWRRFTRWRDRRRARRAEARAIRQLRNLTPRGTWP
ncbi:MAG TPA: hypothetical protein VFS11_10245 [Gemmatimonadales bacterium]|nr:hypothetical protein [Gemmatimonadales bacterium]